MEDSTTPAAEKDRFGKYKILSLLEEGFSGNLYKAQDTETGDIVLLRIVHPLISKHPLFRRALYDQQTANHYLIDHPNILGLIETGKLKGRHYFVTEFVEGENLEKRLARGAMKIEEAAAVLVQIAEGLRAAHRRHVVHGDLKPSDIFLCRDRHGQLNVKVAFFDLATAASESGVSIFGEMVGTPKYLAPEQIAGKPADARSDIYALGVIAYRMFTGREPFEANTALGYLSANAYTEPTPPRKINPAIPAPMEAVLLRMLAKQPSARYQSCQNLIDDIERSQHHAATHRTVLAPAGTDSAFALQAPSAEPRRMNLKTLVVIATIVLSVCMLAMIGVVVWVVKTHQAATRAAAAATTLRTPQTPPAPAPEADPARELFDSARVLAEKEQYAEALKLLRAIVKEHPDSPLAAQAKQRIPEWVVLYEKKEAQRKAKEAADAFAKAVEAAQASMDVRDFDAARKQYEDFLQRHPDAAQAADAAKAIENVRWQEAKYELMEKKHYAGALALLRRLAGQTAAPDLAKNARGLIPDALFRWARAQLKDPTQLDAAIEKLEEIRKNYPNTKWAQQATDAAAKALFERATKRIAEKDYKTALATLRQVADVYHATDWAAKAAKEIPKVTLAYADELFQAQKYDQAYALVTALESELTRPQWTKLAEPFVAKLLYVWSEALDADGLSAAAEEKRQILRNHYGQTEWARRLKPPKPQARPAAPAPAKLVQPVGAIDAQAEADARKALEEIKKNEASLPFQTLLAKLSKVAEAYPQTAAGREAESLLAARLYTQGLRLIGTGRTAEGLALFDRVAAKFPNTKWARQVAQDALAREQTPEGMVYVPGGAVMIGSTMKQVEQAAAALIGAGAVEYAKTLLRQETPPVAKVVAPFYIDRTEVTNEQYLKFVKATNHPPPPHWLGGKYRKGRDKWPVFNVTWKDAADYAAWAGKRLPTEAEWELAARGLDARIFPWGDAFDKARCNSFEGGAKQPLPVGSYPDGASPYGCLDMAGNVSEWTSDLFLPYPGSKAKISEADQSKYVYRGGSFASEALYVRCAYRIGASRNAAKATLGFRCVRSVTLPAAKSAK